MTYFCCQIKKNLTFTPLVLADFLFVYDFVAASFHGKIQHWLPFLRALCQLLLTFEFQNKTQKWRLVYLEKCQKRGNTCHTKTRLLTCYCRDCESVFRMPCNIHCFGWAHDKRDNKAWNSQSLQIFIIILIKTDQGITVKTRFTKRTHIKRLRKTYFPEMRSFVDVPGDMVKFVASAVRRFSHSSASSDEAVPVSLSNKSYN